MKKCRIFVSLFICFLTFALLITTAFAHSGRTDANGGHYNRSTGEYHYHHGYPAHQHPGGVCPYRSSNYVKDSTYTSSTPKPTNKPVATPEPTPESTPVPTPTPTIDDTSGDTSFYGDLEFGKSTRRDIRKSVLEKFGVLCNAIDRDKNDGFPENYKYGLSTDPFYWANNAPANFYFWLDKKANYLTCPL